MVRGNLWMLGTCLALVAGWTDLRSRRIPNWLTMPSLLLGLVVRTAFEGWPGARESLLGIALGLGLLLPLVLLRSLGAGDWKLVGALGAWLGPHRLLTVLFGAIMIAGVMAVALIVHQRRIGQTVRNIGRMLASLFTLHLPGPEVSLDNPRAAKVPFGVAVAAATVLYTAMQIGGTL
ncbi:MAG: prepilin peptidase [Acidobacteria bacterium]|nr:prepilin peptidase [Acidobacteriota bacterium]